MTHKRIFLIIAVISVFFFSTASDAGYKITDLKKVIPTSTEIPKGFIYGKIPAPAKKIFKGNPWFMDKKGIKILAKNIYPGGDHSKISDIHISIIASREHPFGDDIVCYIIRFKDATCARDEIKKIKDHVNNNNDRSIIISKNNIAAYLLVDEIGDFQHIQEMALQIQDKLQKI